MPRIVTPPDFCQVPSRAFPPDPVPGLLSGGGVHLLAAAPGVGKTSLMASLFAAIRDGAPILGHALGTIEGLGWITADRSWAKDTGEWFRKVGYPDIPHYSFPDDGSFNPDQFTDPKKALSILETAFGKLSLPPYSLIGLDPAALFVAGDLNRYRDVAAGCLKLRNLLLQRHWTLIGLMHTAKLKADLQDRYVRLEDRILGSAALKGFSDTQLYLAAPEETGEDYFTLLCCPRQAPQETHKLMRGPEGLFIPYVEGMAEDRQSLPAPVQQLLALIPEDGSEISTEALIFEAQSIPISESSVHRYLRQLIKVGTILKAGHGTYRRKLIQ